jgi:hypothetical protein
MVAISCLPLAACKASGSGGNLFTTVIDQTIEAGYGELRKLEPAEIKLLNIPTGKTELTDFTVGKNPIALSDGIRILGVSVGEIKASGYTLKVYDTDWAKTHTGKPAWPTGNGPASADKAITAFTIAAPAASTGTVIDEGARTVAITVPGGTALGSMTVNVTHTGASISPAKNAAGIDFTTPQTFTVTAADGTKQQYAVTVVAHVAGIRIMPATHSITKGEELQFEAINEQTSSATTQVSWSIEGPHHANTYISAGKLKVDAGETAGTIAVKAALIADTGKTGTANVNPVYDQPASVTIEAISGIERPTSSPGMSGTPGKTAQLRATVLPATANPTVVWTSNYPNAIAVSNVEFDSSGHSVVTLTRLGSAPGPSYEVLISATTVGTPVKAKYLNLSEYGTIGFSPGF